MVLEPQSQSQSKISFRPLKARSGLYTQIVLVYERCCFLALLLLCKDGSQPGTLSPDASESSATGYYGGDSKLSFQHAARQIPWLGWFSS
ncbi:hypothetical protein F2Q70_00013844 [Brassica cretica]|uniref:Uncharacterized protein n=1 Tax=Brassica cretica TaxID=69181 RepID=A0A8S9LVP5_BRACR|nr:hypothetical protein F2Q70_00013844 [Brassica cretica]